MTIDVILPTCNRARLLARALESLRTARIPDGLEVRILVVDNASTDGTIDVVRREMDRPGPRVGYLFEGTPGKPHALNAGLAATDSDLVGLVDDDEEVDAGWFECVAEAFSTGEIDFIGGRCLPKWSAPRPPWLGEGYLGVIGWVDPGPDDRPMDATYPGILMGGNAVVRRTMLQKAGRYSTALSRTGERLLGCEDEDMYHRLLAVGARGWYLADLVIYHHVPADRLTKQYFRRWCFWRAVSLGVMDRSRPAAVAYLAGIPRYRIGRAVRGVVDLARTAAARVRRTSADRFENELALWDVVGFFWGKHFHRTDPPSEASAGTPVPMTNREGAA
jgi:glycosyltransferase involved in cell wall biosynthesis